MNFQCRTLSINDDPDDGCSITFSESTPEIDEAKSWYDLTHPKEKYLFLRVDYPDVNNGEEVELYLEDIIEGDILFIEDLEERERQDASRQNKDPDARVNWYSIQTSEMNFEYNQKDGIIIYQMNKELIEISWGWASITIGLNISEEKLAQLRNVLTEKFGTKVFFMSE